MDAVLMLLVIGLPIAVITVIVLKRSHRSKYGVDVINANNLREFTDN